MLTPEITQISEIAQIFQPGAVLLLVFQQFKNISCIHVVVYRQDQCSQQVIN